MQPAYLLQWLDHVPDLLALSRAHPEHFPYLLESTARGPLGRHSLLLFAAGEVLRREAGGALEGPGEGPGEGLGENDSFFERLRRWYAMEALPDASAADGDAPPFAGGWFIYLGYEMAAEVEPILELPRNDTGLPDAVAHRCPAAIIIYHGNERSDPDRAAVVAESSAALALVLERIGAGPEHGAASAGAAARFPTRCTRGRARTTGTSRTSRLCCSGCGRFSGGGRGGTSCRCGCGGEVSRSPWFPRPGPC